jgi:hypothetical protein
MTRITVTLLDNERRALQVLSEREMRNPRDQAALLIRRALEDAGYLKAEHPRSGECTQLASAAVESSDDSARVASTGRTER